MGAIMGIDPGKNGAVCVLGEPEEPYIWSLDAFDLESPSCNKNFFQVCAEFHVTGIFIERVTAFHGASSSSSFTFGKGFGRLIGWCEAMMARYTLVQPKVWQKEMHVGTGTGTPKEKSFRAARRLFPEVNLIPEGKRKPNDGWADALLIAEYGRRVS
jgi:crossover junction endodeoxyribonuclease RuvC